MNEIRVCNECGEQWEDEGDDECPYCGWDDTYILEDDEDEEDEEEEEEQQG